MPELDSRAERNRSYGREDANRDWSKFEQAIVDLAGAEIARKAHALVAIRDQVRSLCVELEHLKGQRRGGLKATAFYRDLIQRHPRLGLKKDLREAQRWLAATRKQRAGTYRHIADLQAREALMSA